MSSSLRFFFLAVLLSCASETQPSPHAPERDATPGDPPTDAGAGDAGGREDASPDAALDPVTCGDSELHPPCAPGKYCDWPDGCGNAGTCIAPASCDPNASWPEVCGCDGQTYDACAAQTAGVSLAHDGACLPAERQFKCGDFTCDNDSYCLIRTSEDEKPGHFCRPMPEACRPTTFCDCWDEPCDCDLACHCEDVLGAECPAAACNVEGNHVEVRCITLG